MSFALRAWPADYDLYFAPALYKWIRHGKWDIVHCQGYHTFVAPVAMAAAIAAHQRFVVTFHSGGHSSMLRRWLRPLQQLLLRPMLKRADRLIGVSAVRNRLLPSATAPAGAPVRDDHQRCLARLPRCLRRERGRRGRSSARSVGSSVTRAITASSRRFPSFANSSRMWCCTSSAMVPTVHASRRSLADLGVRDIVEFISIDPTGASADGRAVPVGQADHAAQRL